MGQVEEVTGVALDDAAHLVGAQSGDGRAGLTLAPVLPPGAEGGQTQLDGILIGVGTEPRTEDGLDEGMGKAGAGEGLVGVLPAGSASAPFRDGTGIATAVAARLLAAALGQPRVVQVRVGQRIELVG